jgi:protein required for attachment to host cells
MLKIPNNALVFVGDGRKALFLRNHGDAKFPNLRTEKVFEEENPSTHEQGSDRPDASAKPRLQAAEAPSSRLTGTISRSIDLPERLPQPWNRWSARPGEGAHRCGSAKNARRIAQRVPPDVKACIIAEINKDLTNLPVGEIEKHLLGDV